MDSVFREMKQALKEAAEHMLEAHQAMIRSTESIVKVADAANRAEAEHEDLRDTVARLERLVIELVDRAKRNGGGGQASE